MAYFVVHALDKPGRAELREENRPAHRARLRNPDDPVKVHVGGPLLDEGGAMIGTMLVVEAGDKAVVEAFVSGDPYTQAGLYDTVHIHPYLWGLGQPEAEKDG